MTKYAIHELGKPQITRIVSCSPDMLQWQLRGAEVSLEVEGGISDDTHYIAGGVVVAMPTQPTPDHTWNWDTLSWSSPALELLRDRQWAAIKTRRSQLDAMPIAIGNFEIDADPQSIQNIMGALMAMQLTGEATRQWRCADNVMRELTFAQLAAGGTGIAARRQQLIEISDQLWQQLQAATSAADIEAIAWPNN